MSLSEQLKESIDNLNSGQKTSLVVFFMLVFGLLIGVIVWAGSDNYTTVLRSSDLSRVRAASSALDDAGIDHKISSDGTAIETSRVNVGKARIVSTGSGSISVGDSVRPASFILASNTGDVLCGATLLSLFRSGPFSFIFIAHK